VRCARGWKLDHAVAVAVLVSALSVSVQATAKASQRDVGTEVEGIRAVVSEVEEGFGPGWLRRSLSELGGAQIPAGFDVAWEGGPDEELADDPYAAPFRVRRVVERRVLPAVGPASASFDFEADGSLRFVFSTGVDICGAQALELRPADGLRA